MYIAGIVVSTAPLAVNGVPNAAYVLVTDHPNPNAVLAAVLLIV